MAPVKRVAVVGAGIIGMSAAYRILTEIDNVQVCMVYSFKFLVPTQAWPYL